MDYRDHYPAVLRWLSHLVDKCLALGGFSIVTLVFCNAWLRGFAGFDLAWSLEVTSFLLLWSTIRLLLLWSAIRLLCGTSYLGTWTLSFNRHRHLMHSP